MSWVINVNVNNFNMYESYYLISKDYLSLLKNIKQHDILWFILSNNNGLIMAKFINYYSLKDVLCRKEIKLKLNLDLIDGDYSDYYVIYYNIIYYNKCHEINDINNKFIYESLRHNLKYKIDV